MHLNKKIRLIELIFVGLSIVFEVDHTEINQVYKATSNQVMPLQIVETHIQMTNILPGCS